MGKTDREEETQEIKAVRQHTAASLFNALYHQLDGSGYLQTIGSSSDLDSLEVGQLVQVTGAFVGNPLQTILDVFAQIQPYMGMEEQVKEQLEGGRKKANPRKSGNPAVRGQAEELLAANREAEAAEMAEKLEQQTGFRLMEPMRADLEKAQVHDTVIEAADSLRVVLTMSAEFFDEPTSEYLRAGNFTAIGKVTRVLAEDEEINLTRRTVLGAAGSAMAREVIGNIQKIEELALDTGDPVIGSPAVQLLPLAVFV